MMDWEKKDTIRQMANNDDGSLPRVLILGDSISLGYTPLVVEKMKGRAFVTRPACNCGPSEFYLRSRGNIGKWLGEKPWDVIHVNFGIWDHHFINEKEEIFFYDQHAAELDGLDRPARIKLIESKGFHTRTSPAEYAENTRNILLDLKAHSRKVIFALSTPLPSYEERYFGMDCIAEYNDIAVAVCKEIDVPVNDLYSVAKPLREDQKDGCHFSNYGYNILADAVVKMISAYLAF